MSHRPAAADTDKDEQQNLPQCRICLDGPDPDLGRLIRPCLCSGTVSVGGRRAISPTLSRKARANKPIVTEKNSTYTSLVFSDGGRPR